MKRYFSLALALLMGILGFGFSDMPAENRTALLSAQPAVAELTAAAAPAQIIEIKAVAPEQTADEPETEPEKETTEVQVEETTSEPEKETKKESDSGYIWPADINAEIIANYPSYSDGSAHWGVDIGLYDENGCNVSEGTSIYAARDGVVITAYNDGKWNTGFGNYCIIDHGDGTQTLYAHSKNITVSEGDAVEQGQVIGIVGDTGNTTAPHLHFEVRVESGNGFKRVNPLKFISEP